jgi:hypothetical protein
MLNMVPIMSWIRETLQFSVLAGLLMLCPSPAMARALSVVIDTEAANATLLALGNPNLERAQALQVARLPGNVALIRKQAEIYPGSSEVEFVDELIAQARGIKLSSKTLYYFNSVASNAAGIARTLAAIDGDRVGFAQSVLARIEPFSPRDLKVNLNGHIVIGGGSSGFALRIADFYLNLAHYPDQLDTARLMTAHELYHAIQASAVDAAGLAGKRGFDAARLATMQTPDLRRAYVFESFMYNLYQEGTAMYVGDPALMTGDGRMTKFETSRLTTQMDRLDRLATQLDMSVIALTADPQYNYDRAYALGFYGPDQPLYYLGYAMAKAIAQKQGPAALGAMIDTSGCAFMQAYLNLAASDPALPRIGDRTADLAKLYCVQR